MKLLYLNQVLAIMLGLIYLRLDINQGGVMTVKLLYLNQVLAIMLGLIYLRLDINQEGVMNVNGVLFLFLMNATMVNVFAVANVSTRDSTTSIYTYACTNHLRYLYCVFGCMCDVSFSITASETHWVGRQSQTHQFISSQKAFLMAKMIILERKKSYGSPYCFFFCVIENVFDYRKCNFVKKIVWRVATHLMR